MINGKVGTTTIKTLAGVLAGLGFLAVAVTPAAASDEFCPMGGLQIKVEVVKEKAVEWGKDRKKALVTGEDSDAWTVLTLSRVEEDIAIVVAPGAVFFGIAGKSGREVESRDVEKAFGRDFRKLHESVKKEIGDLRQAGAVKIESGDIQALADSVALGVLEKDRKWELTTKDCKGLEVDTSELK